MVVKRVLVTFNRPPFGSIHHVEGLRACVGMLAGVERHTVEAAYLGDGVYFTLRGVNRDEATEHMEALRSVAARFYVEEESLKERGIPNDGVDPLFTVISRDRLAGLVSACDLTMDF